MVLIVFIVLVCALVSGFALYFYRNNTAINNIFSNVAASVDGGFYWHNIARRHEEISEQMRQLFGIAADKNNLDSLLTAFGDVHSTAIKQAIANLANSKNPTVILMNLPEESRQFECRVSGVYDHKNKLGHIVIWVRDITPAHKQQERLIKENNQLKRDVKQFSSILNALPLPVWLRSVDFNIRYCNMAYSIAAEEGTEQTEGHETLELHPHARTLAREAYDSNVVKSERRHVIIEGTRKLYQFAEIPIKSDGIVVGMAQDVTELETVKEELQRHINAQSELLESVTSAMAVFGADMRLKFFNYAYTHLWGLDEAWLDTRPTYGELLEVLREKRRLPEQANFLQFKQQHLKLFTDLIEPREEIFYLPDGRTLRVLAIPHALGGILFAYEDVTDRLALERSYNTLIAVQRATLDNLHEGVVVFGEDGRLRLYNPRFLQLWKLEKAVLSPETHISDLIDKTKSLHFSDDWTVYKQNFIAGLMTRQVQYKRMERTDGSVIESVVVPLPDGASLITFYDVTDSTLVERSLRERNEALSEADRLKTEFLANVSYELRSPLTSISGFSEMLTQNYFGELSLKQKEYVTGILDASQHLMHLINDILDIASIEAGYMKLNVSEFDIFVMLQSVISLVNERIRENNLKFTFTCANNIGNISADETRIKQIIFNLLSNAIKYSNPKGKISLTADAVTDNETGAEEILFTVEDNGVGIALEDQEEIFTKFNKGSSSGAHKSGAGLGLSMVKSFVGLHSGRVQLFSKPGEGTKVLCYLPRHPVKQ